MTHIQRARSMGPKLTEIRRDFHRHPELGFRENRTSQVVAEAREQDLSAARAVWSKKFGQPPRDVAERARQMRFLASRGFPAEVVRRVVGGWDED